MRDLQKDYGDRVDFTVEVGQPAEIEKKAEQYDLGSHGLVGFGTDGKPRVKIPGHDFGKDPSTARAAIEEKVKELLAP